MQIRPIRTDEDHETALREIEALWVPKTAPKRAIGSTCWRHWPRVCCKNGPELPAHFTQLLSESLSSS
jgi:hypothetical protein